MILGFKEQFVEKIKSGQKIHTIREDKNRRWQKGKKIHFATGVRTKNYNQFKEGECKSIQVVHITPFDRSISIGANGRLNRLDLKNNTMFAKYDGFDNEEEFWKWFDKPFWGVIIHWTDFVYS